MMLPLSQITSMAGAILCTSLCWGFTCVVWYYKGRSDGRRQHAKEVNGVVRELLGNLEEFQKSLQSRRKDP